MPSVVMFWINWWIWEVIILITGTISVHDQATHVITMNIYSFFMTWSFGFNQSTCTLVGKKIGQNDAVGAKRIQCLSYAITLSTFIFGSTIIYLNLKYLTSVLSKIPEILDKVCYENKLKDTFSLTFLICMAYIPDAMKYA